MERRYILIAVIILHRSNNFFKKFRDLSTSLISCLQPSENKKNRSIQGTNDVCNVIADEEKRSAF